MKINMFVTLLGIYKKIPEIPKVERRTRVTYNPRIDLRDLPRWNLDNTFLQKI